VSIQQQPTKMAASFLPKSRSTRVAWIVAAALSVALLLLPWLIRLDGKPHADWQQFLGRFHPMVVHLPIGLLVLLPLLEIAGAFRPALREAAGFVLALAFASCLLALSLGFLLAYGSGDAGPAVTRHFWGGIALTIGVMLCMLARLSAQSSQRVVYPAMLIGVLLALVWTADQGGSLTHGSNYLTQYMPASLKRLAFLNAKKPAAASFYAEQINPILDANCVACHGDGKVKGGLRLDSYQSLMKGGQDGPVIVPSKPDNSILFERVTLPSNHKQFMPAEGRPPLKDADIAILKAWIAQGASPTATTIQGVSVRDSSPDPTPVPVGDYSALLPEIRQKEHMQGAKLVPFTSKAEDGLILFTADVAPKFGDVQLAQFQKFAPFIVEAELGRTAVTNASFDTLKQFTHLRALHLEETHVTGDGLAKLAGLTQLTYLNLSGTQVTAAAAAPLSTMKNLRHVYLYNTPAQPAPVAEQTQSTARNAL
jgi:uncharacterized membrane protein/mono/diheme cytochrome c family protein